MTSRAIRILAALLAAALGCAPGRPEGAGQPSPPPAGPSPNPIAAQSTTAPEPPLPGPAPPRLRLPDGVRPVRMRPALTIVPEQDEFSGTVEIDLDVLRPTRVVWLNADDLSVGKAEAFVNGRRIAGHAVPQPKDFVGIALDDDLPAGPATLRLEYQGKISRRDTGGIFKSQERGAWYATTHFEPLDARRAYPCFDEPSYKFPWSLSLRVKTGESAFSNTPEASREAGADGFTTIRFAETRPLPSYLTAFAVGPFERLDAGRAGQKPTPVGVIVPQGEADLARWTVRTTPEVVPHLEQYFGTAYPFEKLDVIAVPLGRGAMENAGLVTFSSPILLARPAAEGPSFRRRQTGVTVHEFAHMWFGDLVTTAWWDDLWLNEAFATWMEPRTLASWFPQWNLDAQRAGYRAVAMAADALSTARRIRQPIESDDDVENAFDAITYQKGASVIAMFERFVGEERFRRGVRRYMREHAYGNATSADFLGAISAESGMDVAPAFSTFLDQAGVPIVSASLRCERGKPPRVDLAQERYTPLGADAMATAQVWHIPVCVRGDAVRACAILATPKGSIDLPAKRCPSRLVANDGATGYYRVATWDPRLLAGGAPKLRPVERMAALSDLAALSKAGKLPYADVLRVAAPFARDADRGVVEAAIELVGHLREEEMISSAQDAAYRGYIHDLFAKRAAALGWDPRPGEPDESRLLRADVLDVLGDAGADAGVLAEARRRAGLWLRDRNSVEPEVAKVALWLSATRGDRAYFDALHAAARAEKDRSDRLLLLSALGSFRDPSLAQEALQIALSDEFPLRESIALVFGAAKSAATRTLAYEFVRAHYDALASRLPRRVAPSLLVVASALCDAAKAPEVEAFFKDRVARSSGGPRRFAQAMESLRECAAFRSAQRPGVESFFDRMPSHDSLTSRTER